MADFRIAVVEALGLSADATDDQVFAALDASNPNAEPGGPPGDPSEVAHPEASVEPDSTAAADDGEDEAEGRAPDATAVEPDAALADGARVLALEARVEAAEAALAERREAELSAARESIIDGAIAEGRYLPRQRDRLLSLAGACSVDDLRALVNEAPPVLNLHELGSAGDNADQTALLPTTRQARILLAMGGGAPSEDLKTRFVNGTRIERGLPVQEK